MQQEGEQFADRLVPDRNDVLELLLLGLKRRVGRQQRVL